MFLYGCVLLTEAKQQKIDISDIGLLAKSCQILGV